MTMSSQQEPGLLEEQALKRREKLLALKRKRDGQSSNDPDSSRAKDNGDDVLPTPIFRSYKPIDGNFHDNMIGEIKPVDIGEQVKEQLDAAKSQMVIDHVDVSSLAPRKPDWDLKRDITKKMARLEKRTRWVIAELIRERLQKKKEDFATVVTVAGEEVTFED
ncbi:hypothetical protein ABEB36_011541 [Hypothenemus hampei]|uniref:Coiled-coil domain-containing protein 12 n=1 Tax=Hypothenemus hampei TaxID=57062 RepID=A0ABD1ECJ5_HYPHA